MNKKDRKKAEARSRANHPTAGGKPSIDPQATLYAALHDRDRNTEIVEIWAAALNDRALMDNFGRYLADEGKGWKKNQVMAMLKEVHRRYNDFSFDTAR